MISVIHRPTTYRLQRRSLLLASLVATILLIGGCSSAPKIDPIVGKHSANWQLHFNNVFNINNWYLRSKLAITTPEQGFGGHLSWLQNPEDYEIDFVGPMGVGMMKIIGDAQATSLLIPDKPPYSGGSPEQLLRDHTGYQLPVSQLYFWARGIPNPDLPYQIEVSRSGQLSQLQQLGWDIQYFKYQPHQNLILPNKVVMKKGAIKIKLVRLNWLTANSQEPR